MPKSYIRALIDKLFEDSLLAEGTPAPGQEPAVECHLMVRGLPHPIAGALSRSKVQIDERQAVDENYRAIPGAAPVPVFSHGLRLLSPLPEENRGHQLSAGGAKAVFVEHFFDYDDVVMVVRRVEMKLETARIISPRS